MQAVLAYGRHLLPPGLPLRRCQGEKRPGCHCGCAHWACTRRLELNDPTPAQVAVFHRATRAVPVTLFCLSLAFSLLHVLTAAEVKRWAKKRHDLGLEGYGFPWEVICPLLPGSCIWLQILLQDACAAAQGTSSGP